MSRAPAFDLTARVLHWTMAVAILAMLFVGVTMVTSVSQRPWLIDLHRPLGIAILALAIWRFVHRLRRPPPPLPADLPRWQAMAAHASHWLLYGLMVAMPLIGWAMMSAGGYPVAMFAGFHLPALLSPDPAAYAWLRDAHAWLARLLFVTVLGHLSAALYHAWIRRDGVFSSMTGKRVSHAAAADAIESCKASGDGKHCR